MSLWQESESADSTSPCDVVDVSFRLSCSSLPVDHSLALSESVTKTVPWLKQSPFAGVHTIHVAGSQNGWERPDSGASSELQLSRRTRLRVRVASDQAQQLIDQLQGSILDVAGFPMQIDSASTRGLVPSATLFSRYTAFDQDNDFDNEGHFVDKVINECQLAGFQPRKILCGKISTIAGPKGPLLTRSVLLEDVPASVSLTIQQRGLGDFRLIGCGIMLPHKSTAPVQD